MRLAVLEDAAFAVGDGSGKPLGIAHSSSGYAVITAATGSSTVFKTADVAAAYAALPVAYVPSATWVMAPTAFRSLAGLTDTAGSLVFPTLHTAEPTLYARPVVVAADMPTSAANARSVFFGDLQQAYAVRRVSEIGVQRLQELHSDNGQIGYRAVERSTDARRSSKPDSSSAIAPPEMRWPRRQPRTRRHPSPPMAAAALKEGHCMYAPVSACTGPPGSVGLRNDDDHRCVLVCKAHYGRLRSMNQRQLDDLERGLLKAFGRNTAPVRDEETGVLVI